MTGITWGYSRCSTDKQDVTYQVELLQKAGCRREHIITDVLTGRTQNRPGFQRLNASLRRGDRVILTQLSRAGRTQRETIDWLVGEQDPPGLEKRGITFEIINMPFLGSGRAQMPAGVRRTVLELLGYLAEEEVADKAFRTKAGMRSRMARGMKPGRRPLDPDLVKVLKEHVTEKGWSLRKVAKTFGTSTSTVMRYLHDASYAPAQPRKMPGSPTAPVTIAHLRRNAHPKVAARATQPAEVEYAF